MDTTQPPPNGFMEHVTQSGSKVAYDNGYGVFQINNLLLEDLIMDNFQGTGLIDDVLGLLS
ncbi:MAG: hypothetical protein MK098_10565 [Marinovum sp.]|nr:hypothetical protein [Marinovum sp.]